jgi:hypothetical protein
VSEHEQRVVLANPRRLQALRRALEERAVLTYCTDGATFRYQRPLSAGLPVGSYVTLEVPGGATYLGQVITQQVVLGESPLIGIDLDMDLTDDAGASKVSQLTTPLRLRLLEGTGTVLGWLEGHGLARTTHRDVFDAAELAAAGTALVEGYLRAGTGSVAPLPVGRCSYVDGESADLAYLAEVFSQVPGSLLGRALRCRRRGGSSATGASATSPGAKPLTISRYGSRWRSRSPRRCCSGASCWRCSGNGAHPLPRCWGPRSCSAPGTCSPRSTTLRRSWPTRLSTSRPTWRDDWW